MPARPAPVALHGVLAVAALGAALAAPGLAHAHGSRVGVGVYVGPPAVYYRPGPYGYGPRFYGPRYYAPFPRGYGYGYGYPYPYYAYPPAFAYPPVTIAPAAPPVYVEREDAGSRAPLESGFWYYCRNPEGYYPTVRDCAGGWEKVPPRPPGAQ